LQANTDVLKAEAETMFRVRSEHCVTIHSVEELGSRRALLMEYIDGVSVEDLAKSYFLTNEETPQRDWPDRPRVSSTSVIKDVFMEI